MTRLLVPAAAHTPFLQSTTAAVVLAVLAGLLVGVAVAVLTRKRDDVSSRVSDFVTPMYTPEDEQLSLVERALGDTRSRSIGTSPFWQRLAVDLDVADIAMPGDRIVLLTILGAIAVGWVLFVETSSPIAALLGLVVPFVTISIIRTVADRQRRRFDDQLPDNLGVIASAMRAGQTFVGALSIVIEDAPEPSRRELRRAVTDEQLGIPLPEALGHVTERMRSDDFHHVAVVATLQRDTGGNTAEVIDLVTETIRERLDLRRMVRSLTAQGRLSAMMLSSLPVGLLLFISVIDPGYDKPLFHTTAGIIALVIAGVMVLGGSLILRRIVNIKI